MPLKFHNKNECPPGMFRFCVKETGAWISGIDWQQFIGRVKDHYRANNLPIGLLFDDMVEDQACMNTDASASYQDGYGVSVPTKPPTTFQQLKMATGILLQWFLTGKRKEPIEEVNRRARICVGCAFNQRSVDCPSCSMQTVRDLVGQFVKGEPSPYDNQISACRVCGCSLPAKIRIPLDILKQNEPDFMEAQYPPWCWLKTPQVV